MVYFEGQVYDAFELLCDLVAKAERSIVLVDGYVDVATLNILAKKRGGVAVTIWTKERGDRLTAKDIETFNAQYPTLEVLHTEAFHDRFLILDGEAGYHIGASLKDAGKKGFAISALQDAHMVKAVLDGLES